MPPSDQPIRVLIVDDEPVARRGIVQLLGGDADFTIVGECSNGKEMLAAVEREQPDLIFLDVRMPGMDGLRALARLKSSEPPLIIFVTGFDQYAMKAFEAHAIDYLMKPYSRKRFRSACDHAKQQLRRRRIAEGSPYQERLLQLLEDLVAHRNGVGPSTPSPEKQFLVKKARGRVVIVPSEAVLWVEARKDYVRLHTADGPHLIRETMGNIEQDLDPSSFIRVHRSAIVRIAAIAEIRTIPDGKLEVALTDGTHHPVSPSGRRTLQTRLGLKM